MKWAGPHAGQARGPRRVGDLSAHKAPVVRRWSIRPPRVHFHFTPTYASWLNLVERFFGMLTDKALRGGSHTSVPQLRGRSSSYQKSQIQGTGTVVAGVLNHGTCITPSAAAPSLFDQMIRGVCGGDDDGHAHERHGGVLPTT